jgi:hypothetical protein
MMKVHYLAALGTAFFAATVSGTSWAQDAAPARTGGPTDHSRFVGDFAIGFLGIQSIDIASDPITGDPTTVNAPVIGGRYWLDAGMGIDAGIGFAFGSASTTTETGDQTLETDLPQPTAFILHGGVPFALADSQYFVFELIPELNIGFGGNTIGDNEFRGFHLDIGARAGAEVHFGFIDIPQLSLQAGIGVNLAYNRISVSNDETDTSSSVSSTSFGTTVGNNPWDIFTSSISALYYFDR